MFKKLLLAGAAAWCLYYVHGVYKKYDDVHNSTDPNKSVFDNRTPFNKEFQQEVEQGKYDTFPPPAKPAPERLVFKDGKFDAAAVDQLMEEHATPGVWAPKSRSTGPWFQEKSEEQKKEAERLDQEMRNEVKARGYKRFADLPRTMFYEGHHRTEIYKNCVAEPLKGGYGHLVTCCEGAKKNVIRGVAYWGHMTMADATITVNSNIDENGRYATPFYIMERHYYECAERKGALFRPEYLYVEQDIPDSLAYASHKAPPTIQKITQNTRQ